MVHVGWLALFSLCCALSSCAVAPHPSSPVASPLAPATLVLEKQLAIELEWAPHLLAFDRRGDVWLAGTYAAKYSPDGERLATIKEPASALSIAFDSQNNIWLSDMWWDIRKYSPEGTPLKQLKFRYDFGDGQLFVDRTDHLWLENGSQRDENGDALLQADSFLARHIQQDSRGTIWVVNAGRGISKYTSAGTRLATFLDDYNGHRLAIDRDDRIWLTPVPSTGYPNELIKVSNDGQLLARALQGQSAYQVVVDPANNAWVSFFPGSPNEHRLAEVKPNGDVAGWAQFDGSVAAIAVAPDGALWVSETVGEPPRSGRVTKYRLP